ncbi:hypothetical protein NpNSSI1_00011332 [Neofusicoccum parvum]|nr:hypothetical protein NpNSSI1_00011332 [Neofusicoccum parvum]
MQTTASPGTGQQPANNISDQLARGLFEKRETKGSLGSNQKEEKEIPGSSSSIKHGEKTSTILSLRESEHERAAGPPQSPLRAHAQRRAALPPSPQTRTSTTGTGIWALDFA